MNNSQNCFVAFFAGALITMTIMFSFFISISHEQQLRNQEAAVKGGYGHYDEKTGNFIWGINK